MNSKHLTASIVLSMFLFFNGCMTHKTPLPSREEFPDFYKSTFEMDSTRKQLGLPLLDKHLVFAGGFDQMSTIEPFAHADFTAVDAKSQPRLDLKAIFWDSTGIVFEQNYFTGPANERLQLIYGYRVSGSWTHIGYDCKFLNDTISFTKEQADSILRRWGFSY